MRAMLSFLFFLILVVITSPISFSGEGGMDSGGGNSVVCGTVAPTTVELLDLFEIKNIWGLRLRDFDPGKDAFEIATEIAKVIDQGGAGADLTYRTTVSDDHGTIERRLTLVENVPPANSVQSQVKYVMENRVIMKPGVRLRTIPDSDHFIVPEDCTIEQTARYDDSGNRIFIVGDYWNRMDNVNKAALLVHEALYRHLRIQGEENSLRTRRVIGLAFAGYFFEPLLAGAPRTAQLCWSDEETPAYIFLLYQPQRGSVLQFLRFDNAVPLSRTLLLLSIDLATPAPPLHQQVMIGDLVVPPGDRFPVAVSTQWNQSGRLERGIEKIVRGPVSMPLRHRVLCR